MNLQNQIDYLKGVLGVDMFDDCTVPDGLDMARVRGAIVMRCGLLTPIFSEPELMRDATQQFFFENQWNFQQIVNVLKADYNPIENVFEDRTETTDYGNTMTITKDDTGTTTHEISAENVTSYQSDRKITEKEDDRDVHAKTGRDTLTMHRNGNIGVTSAQKLINESLDLVERFNPYRMIADLYENELCLGIY